MKPVNPERHPRRLFLIACIVVLLAVFGVAACDILPQEATPTLIYVTATPDGGVAEAVDTPTPPPNVVYVTATPEGASEGGAAGPTATPYVVYVTPTPDGAGESGAAGATETPYVIYVTATPLLVGPFGAAQGREAEDVPRPTLDLSSVTQVPTRAPTQSGVQPSPTATIAPTSTPAATPTATPTPVVPRPRADALYSDKMGINFISSAQHRTDEARFNEGLDAGAGWDRFAIYWNEIEQQPNRYDWGVYDEAVRNDVIYGLQTDAILLGFPDIYKGEGNVPGQIFEPVFADGSDTPGADKEINPNNAWAEFVYAAVNRYKPGGVISTREGWPEGAGVRVWEIWNEPDFQQFWQGSVEEYARLLKVAYIAARQADPEARIMVGGLVMFEKPDFIYRLLDIYRNDQQPVAARYPFDIVAVHSYSHPAYSFYVLQSLQTLLAVHGLMDTPIWINESGVAVWNDYPGPEWATRTDQVQWRASMLEQSSYIIENATFAFLGGASKLFHFQLYDDCGNQPAGTTFAPNDGSLCEAGQVCWGDALGLLRNRADNECFNQHPEPGTPRPAYSSYRVVSEVFGDGPIIPLSGYTSAGRQWMIFSKPETAEIITVVWDESGQTGDVTIPARGESAELVLPNGERQELTPGEDGVYTLELDGATNRSQSDGSNYNFMIGGPPVILIEPAGEIPIVTMLPLLDVTRTAALVRWRASDPSQIVRYEVYYRDDTSGENEWVLWIDDATEPGEGLFSPGAQRSYSFFVRGLMADGRWTADAPYAQAWTSVE